MFLFNLVHEFTTIELIVMVIYGALILLLVLFGGDLLERYLRADKRMRKDAAYRIFFIIAVAMLGYGVYLLPAFINYFLKADFDNNGITVNWVPPFQYFVVLLIIIPIGYVCLLILFADKKIVALLTGIVGALAIVYMFVLFVIVARDPDQMNPLIAVPAPTIIPVLVLIFIFAVVDFFGIVYILAVKLGPQREVRKRVLFGIAGIIIAGIGGFMEIRLRGENNWGYVVATAIELAGFLVMRYFFLSIPSYDEFAWKSGMKELHVIIAETGISLYYQSFASLKPSELKGDIRVTASIPEDEERPNTDLIAGGLVGIKGMLSEISGERGKLENIEIGEKSLVFKQGKVVLCLLLADENLGVYHSMLDELSRRIEAEHPDLDNFNGDTRKLHIQPIAEEVFGMKALK